MVQKKLHKIDISKFVNEKKLKFFLKSDWNPSMLRIIYEFFQDKIVDLYLEKKIDCRKPNLKRLDQKI